MKFTKESFGGPQKQILKFPDHYVALAVTVDDEGVSADENGKKIVPAGTIVGGGFINDTSKFAVKSNDENAEGVLFNDVDVTYGPAAGAVVIHGFIETGKLPESPTEEAVSALKQITFIK
ncbi:hypothetical protein [Oceanobacillus indicireducens]|uniref:Structural protein - phage associated n=1 Tax=Oceanobacillus indicireducens TaxID=1004261 RepID=A0A918D4A2_9BACI|nr:hypothetical protein [Oceanobacillus indicireducens]GGN64305.1 putative structural protein - phage associated [Oceanobacillus indicireducens]